MAFADDRVQTTYEVGDPPEPAELGPEVPYLFNTQTYDADGNPYDTEWIETSPGEAFMIDLDFTLESGEVAGAYGRFTDVVGYIEILGLTVEIEYGSLFVYDSTTLYLETNEDTPPGTYTMSFAVAPADADGLDETRVSDYVEFELVVD